MKVIWRDGVRSIRRWIRKELRKHQDQNYISTNWLGEEVQRKGIGQGITSDLTDVVLMNIKLRPKVSIIVTAENNASALRYALESVVWQTFVHFEVWVIGNNCRDHSEDVVNSFCDPRIFWFNTPSPVNDFRLIIEGLKRSRGEYVAYLRDTDLWLVNHLESLIECIENDDQDIVFSITQCIHSHSHSVLSIPMLPDLPMVPYFSSVLHKRNCVFVPMPEGAGEPDFNKEFFQRAMEEKLRMSVVPVTTGLRFLWKEAEHYGSPQGVYIEKLKNDPDFVNKELSAILVRSEKDHRSTGYRYSWKRWLSPLERVIAFFKRRHESKKQLIRRDDFPVRAAPGLKQRDVSLIPKSARAV